MALYKDFAIDGGTVTLDMDTASVVVHTKDAVWMWQDSDGGYAKIYVKDGAPQTDASFRAGDVRKTVSADWSERVKPQSVEVNVTGDAWMVEMANEIIEQIAEQTRNGRIVITRPE